MIIKKIVQSYKACFDHPNAKHCLLEIANFCNARGSCYRDNQLEMARMNGRREVWLLIQERLNFDLNKLNEMQKEIEKGIENGFSG